MKRTYFPGKVIALLAAFVLAACGGGNGKDQFQKPAVCESSNLSACGALPPGTPPGGNPETGRNAMTLTLQDQNGNPANVLTGASPLIAKVRIVDATGKPVPNAVVRFATDNTLATIIVPSAMSDQNGIASATMALASPAATGAATITATTSIPNPANPASQVSLSGSANFRVEGNIPAAGKNTMSVTLHDLNGNPANVLDGVGPLTARAKIVDALGQPVPGAVVRFSTDAALASIATPTAMSDQNGVANAALALASPSAIGAATVTAAASIPDPAKPGSQISLSGSANFRVGASTQDQPASVVLVSISPADKSILLKGAIGVGRVQTAQVTFKVTGKNGQPIPKQKVRFSLEPANADLTFATDTGVTGQGGEVTAIVNSGNTVTVAAVRITVLDQNNQPVVSAVSDQISVTNTTLNPEGITLSAEKHAFEGRDVAGMSTKITARLTDLQGGQITDGTAVTFTTNGGAITGENNSAKCATKDGACPVSLVGQNPMPPEGIATVIASLQLSGRIVTRDIQIVLSGSLAQFTGDFTIDATASCDAQLLTFNLADVNGNVMPEGSKLSIKVPTNASGTIINDTVKYPHNLRGGTTHQVQVMPGSDCSATGSRIVTGSFILLLTTPYGIESSQVVTVRYRTT